MIYQNPYQNIRTADIYGARKQAAQDQLAEQQKQLALQQKEQEGIVYKGQLATQALVGFKALSTQQKAAQWNAYRQRIESLVPETKGILPSVWDSNDPSYEAELDSAIGGLSKTYFKPEQTKLGAEETLLEGTFGVAPKQIARGIGKPEEAYDKLVDVDDVDIATGQPIVRTERRRKNDEGFWQSGSKVYPDEYPQGVEKEKYYKAFGITPKSKSAVNSLTAPPSAPMAVPGQTELPPRQFNAPSPTNRAGETNVGFPIDENAMLQQQQIMPTMGNSMLRGAGAVMADEFAPQPRNALVGGMMPPPSQFAELMPAGSAPNRFGSPGVEGIDFAATGGQGPVDARGIPLSAIGSARPRYVATDKGQVKEIFKQMTPEEIRKEGQDPARTTGRVSQFGVIQWKDKTTPAQLRKEGAEAAAAEATAEQNKSAVRRARTDIVSFLRGVRRYRDVLNKLGNQQFVDTGPFDTLIVENTQLGSELNGLGDTVGEELKSAMKVAGDPKTSDELKEMVNQLPNTRRRFPQNIKNLNFREEYFLDRIGVQTSVANDAEFDALTPGTVFVDLNDGGIYRKMKAK